MVQDRQTRRHLVVALYPIARLQLNQGATLRPIPIKLESELMSKELSEYTITAKLLNTYEIKVMATDSAAALASLDEWVAEDFTDFITNQQWDIEAI